MLIDLFTFFRNLMRNLMKLPIKLTKMLRLLSPQLGDMPQVIEDLVSASILSTEYFERAQSGMNVIVSARLSARMILRHTILLAHDLVSPRFCERTVL